MSDQLDLPQTEALLRAHYVRSDAGRLRPELAARIGADLEAQATGRNPSARLHLEPVRAASPVARLGLGWSLAAAALVVVLVASWIAVGRLAAPPTAASPSGFVSPVASASGEPTGSASGGLVVPSPSGALSHQRAIAFSDRRHGIVVGEYQGKGAVWTTADEGQTWSSTPVEAPPLDSVAVLGTRAWASAACPADPSCTPAVLASSDSGATWTVVGSAPVVSLTFVSAAHGFGVNSASNVLVETTDGGLTWSPYSGPCEAGFYPVGVSFVDAMHGWAACGSDKFAAGNSPKEVVSTTDGGASWTVRARGVGSVTPPDSLPFAGTFRGIQMLPDGTGIAWLRIEGLVRTTDAGATWTRLPLGDAGTGIDWPGAAIAPDGSLFALTASNSGSATFNLGFDDGRTWKPYVEFSRLPAPGATPTPEPTSPPQPAIADSGVAFFDALHGIAVGNDEARSYVWRTEDGGKTWTVAPLGTRVAMLNAVRDNSAWVAVSTCPAGAQPGDPACTSVLERSDDRGATWRVVGHQALSSISFGDATHGFGVGPLARPGADARPGGGGGIYATRDGGATWQPVANPYPCASQTPTSVSFVSATHGWVGCSGAVGAGQGMKSVMETSDGGRTWSWRSRVDVPGGAASVGSIPSSDYLDTISMQPDGAGFMTGLRGSTFRTADGGRTWVTCPPGEFDAFNTSAAAIVPGGPWFVIQSGWVTQDSTTMQARLMRSDDLGKTWTQVGPLMPSP